MCTLVELNRPSSWVASYSHYCGNPPRRLVSYSLKCPASDFYLLILLVLYLFIIASIIFVINFFIVMIILVLILLLYYYCYCYYYWTFYISLLISDFVVRILQASPNKLVDVSVFVKFCAFHDENKNISYWFTILSKSDCLFTWTSD